MDAPRFERLTQRQRECLRLVDARLSAKEIAERLAISPGVVNEHLSAARRLLGTSRSSVAARMLREHEACEPLPPTPHPVGGYPLWVPHPRETATIDRSEPRDGGAAGLAVGEAPARYEAVSNPAPESVLRTLARELGSRHHDLNAVERILLGLLAGFVAVALVGAFITLQRALV